MTFACIPAIAEAASSPLHFLTEIGFLADQIVELLHKASQAVLCAPDMSVCARPFRHVMSGIGVSWEEGLT